MNRTVIGQWIMRKWVIGWWVSGLRVTVYERYILFKIITYF